MFQIKLRREGLIWVGKKVRHDFLSWTFVFTVETRTRYVFFILVVYLKEQKAINIWRFYQKFRKDVSVGISSIGYNDLGYNVHGYNVHGYNDLVYNDLVYNDLVYNDLGFNDLGYNVHGYNNLTVTTNTFP